MEIFNTISTLAIFAAWPASFLFVIFYGFKSNWRATVVGRTLMYLSVSMLVLVSMSFMGLFLGDYELRPLVRAASLSYVSLMLWNLFFTLRLVQTKKVTLEEANYDPWINIVARIKKVFGRV